MNSITGSGFLSLAMFTTASSIFKSFVVVVVTAHARRSVFVCFPASVVAVFVRLPSAISGPDNYFKWFSVSSIGRRSLRGCVFSLCQLRLNEISCNALHYRTSHNQLEAASFRHFTACGGALGLGSPYNGELKQQQQRLSAQKWNNSEN